MKIILTLLFVGIFLKLIPFAVGQDLPHLVDNILVCNNGVFPNYISCDDSICVEKRFYLSGNIMAKGKCNAGKKVGMWTAYHKKGNIMSKGIIKKELLYGNWEFYYENGNKKAEGEFKIGQFELGCAGSGNFEPATIKNSKWIF